MSCPKLRPGARLHTLPYPDNRYITATAETLASVRSVEASLKRLKKVKRGNTAASSGSVDGLSDDDKIRKQIALDVEQYGKDIDAFGVGRCEEYTLLVKTLEEEQEK